MSTSKPYFKLVRPHAPKSSDDRKTTLLRGGSLTRKRCGQIAARTRLVASSKVSAVSTPRGSGTGISSVARFTGCPSTFSPLGRLSQQSVYQSPRQALMAGKGLRVADSEVVFPMSDSAKMQRDSPMRPRTMPTGRLLMLCALLGALLGRSVRAELPSDSEHGPQVASLAVPAPKHWVWVNDFVFPHMSDGMAYLVDGDSGRYLGTLSTGYSFAHLLLSRDGKVIFSPETYFSRGTRGTRTDVVTLYDPGKLTPIGEIVIPPKRSSNLPMIANNVLTDDDRFLLIYNFNPAQSVTVVDTKLRKFVREVETPGCALIYPTGPRSFFSVCGDGSLSLVDLDDTGAAHQKRTQPLFDMAADPVTEKAVRVGRIWYFVSF